MRAPILAANRAHRAVHYTELLPAVRQKTGTDVSLRSLQRYGKEELGAKQKRGVKRTADESEYTAACGRRGVLLPVAVDMIACCVGDRVLLPKIFTPKERAGADVRGINRSMLLQFIDDVLVQAVEGLRRYPLTLVLIVPPFTWTWTPFARHSVTAARSPSKTFCCC